MGDGGRGKLKVPCQLLQPNVLAAGTFCLPHHIHSHPPPLCFLARGADHMDSNQGFLAPSVEMGSVNGEQAGPQQEGVGEVRFFCPQALPCRSFWTGIVSATPDGPCHRMHSFLLTAAMSCSHFFRPRAGHRSLLWPPPGYHILPVLPCGSYYFCPVPPQNTSSTSHCINLSMPLVSFGNLLFEYLKSVVMLPANAFWVLTTWRSFRRGSGVTL